MTMRRMCYTLFMILFAGWFRLLIPIISQAWGTTSTASNVEFTPSETLEFVTIGAAAALTGLLLGISETRNYSYAMKHGGRRLCFYLVAVSFVIAAFATPASYAYVYEKRSQFASQTIVDSHFEDGFESRDFSAWSGTTLMTGNTATVVSSPSYGGSFSAQFNVIAGAGVRRAYVYENLSGQAELYASAYVYLADGLPLARDQNMWLIQFEGPVGTVLASFGVRADASSSRWAVQSGYHPYSLAGSSVALPAEGQWYLLRAYYTHASSGKTIILTVNGVEVAFLNQNTAAKSNITRARFGIGYYNTGSAASIYVDNVTVENVRAH